MNSTQSAPPGRHNPVIIAGIAALTIVIIVVVAAFASGGLHFGADAKAAPVAAAHHHKKHHHHHADGGTTIIAGGGQQAPAPAAQAPAQTGLRYVGTGTYGEDVYANGNTSDPFALQVDADWWTAGLTDQGPVPFWSYSTVTGQSYQMTGSTAGASGSAGAITTITGGNGAEVQLRF